MPTIQEHQDKVVRLISGGVFTDENPYDDNYIYSLINDARAFILRQNFIKTRRWSQDAIQRYYPEFLDYYQDSVCYTRFKLPTGFIQGHSANDGLVYFGADTNNIYKTNNFYVIQNRNSLSDFLSNSRMSPATGRYIGVLIEEGVATVISKDHTIKRVLVAGVWENPLDIPTFNQREDQYPISDDLVQPMYDLIYNNVMRIALQRPNDTLSNTQTPTIQVK